MTINSNTRIYSVVGCFLPLSLFFSFAIPVFIDRSARDRKLYIQFSDQDGIVREFIPFQPNWQSLIFLEGMNLINWVGQKTYHAYARSNGDVIYFDDENVLRKYLHELVSSGYFMTEPLAGIEISRFLQLKADEIKYAEIAAIEIAQTNRDVARNWIERGVISDDARISARIALENGYQISDYAYNGESETILELSDAFVNYYREFDDIDFNGILARGSSYRNKNGIGVFNITLLVLCIHDIGIIEEGAYTEYARLVASQKCPEILLFIPDTGESRYVGSFGRRGVRVIRDDRMEVIRMSIELALTRLSAKQHSN